MLEGFGAAGFNQLGELEFLRRRPANRQWQRFCNQDAAGEHWHCPLLAVGDAGRRRHRLVGQETATVRHRDAPAETPRFFRWDVEILLGLRVSEQLVRRFVVEGLFERKPHRPALRSVGLVGDFDADSTVSPSRKKRGGLGWTIRSFAVTAWASR